MKISLSRGIPATALFFCAMLTSFFTMAADVAGDYRSITTGSSLNWSSRTTWERYNGSTWVMPTAGEGYPGQYSGTGTVTISNSPSNTIKLNVSPAILLVRFILENQGPQAPIMVYWKMVVVVAIWT